MRHALAQIAARLALVAIGLLAAEAGLQAVCRFSPEVAARLSGLKPGYIADPVLDVRGDSSLDEYDERGFRNAARPAKAALIAIGDSQTEGSGVARENAWPQRLAARSEIEVYQMAFGSYGPGHYAALLDEALAFDPATVVVAFYAGNDLANMYEWVYEARRSPELASAQPQVLADVRTAEQQRGALSRVWNETTAVKKQLADSPALRWLNDNVVDRSKLVALARRIVWRLERPPTELDSDRDGGDWDAVRARAEHGNGELLVAVESGALRTVLTPAARLAALDTTDPRIGEGLRMTIETLRAMARRTAGKARFFVLDVPTKELVYAEVTRASPAAPSKRYDQLLAAETAVHAALAAALARDGIELIDALPALRAVVASGTNPYPLDWDGHPNAAGHEAIAGIVARRMSLAVCP